MFGFQVSVCKHTTPPIQVTTTNATPNFENATLKFKMQTSEKAMRVAKGNAQAIPDLQAIGGATQASAAAAGSQTRKIGLVAWTGQVVCPRIGKTMGIGLISGEVERVSISAVSFGRRT